MPAPTENLVGIDLGTTFSAIATLDDRGQAITLPNREGEMLTPSVILLEEGGAVVGQAARDVAMEFPDRVGVLVKRYMGYPKYGYTVAGREFRPETLQAILLRKLALDAELRIGPIKKAVITVPAYFDDTRRKATQDAGRIAGLEVIDIIDEPTAAALAYSFQQAHGGSQSVLAGGVGVVQSQTLMVYDLGGGTFDCTLVRLSPKRFETLAIEGDVRLGGKDWDDRIVEYVIGKFKEKYDEDPRDDAVSYATLVVAAERAKRTLSKLNQTNITCTHAGKVLSVPLTRAEFEGLTRDLLMRTRFTAQQVLEQAKLTWDKVDRVLLVGGSTHMPMTGRMIQEISGKPPDNSLAVSEVVARGAAIHAGIVSARHVPRQQNLSAAVQDVLEQIVEINVNSHSLGIEIKQNKERFNDILVPKNTQLPTAASRVYHTIGDGQQRVRVKVLQGEAHQAEACISIGECWVDGLPPNLPKHSPIQVRCGVGSNGLIDVMALDMTSGKMVRTEMHRASGLAEDEIKREADWVQSLRIQ